MSNGSPPSMEELRRRVEERLKKKQEEFAGLIGHFIAYMIVNTLIVGAWLSSGDISFPGALVVPFFWGIGMFAHAWSYYNEHGPGRERRERQIQEEVEREMTRIYGEYYGEKPKNDFSADRPIRLTEDGELTDSFVDEIDQQDQYNRR